MGYNQLKNKNNFIFYFLATFSILLILSLLVLCFVEMQVRMAKIEELKSTEQRVVKLQNDFIGREFKMILSDLHYLHHAYEKQLSNEANYGSIAANWTVFSTQKRIYDQIRYIDINGDELIRININENGGYSVPDSELQNKKDRYYFYESVKLNKEDVYISPLDLNIENGKIEEPIKPMIRLSTPIYGDKGELKGIIVLNYLAEHTLDRFRELAKNSQGEIMLLNSKGYWLSSDNPNNDWNFMFDERKETTFVKEYPEEWNEIQKQENQIVSKNGIFTFSSVLLSNKYYSQNMESRDQNIVLGDGNWYVVSVLDRNKGSSAYFEEDFVALLIDVSKQNMALLLLIGIVSGVVAFLIYVNRKSYSEIKFHSEYDALTKAYNRRAGIMRLNELFSIDNRRSAIASLCFIDINGLKEVNDTLGHISGDELIITVSDVIRSTIREHDFLVRMGGDEFLIVFNGIDSNSAENIWQRIVTEYNDINQRENRPYIISVSHGIVDYCNSQKTHVDDLINVADERMYREKQIIKAGLSVVRTQHKV